MQTLFFSLDFPNAAGHAVIAECVQAVLDGLAAEAETAEAEEEPTPAPTEDTSYSFTLIL